MSREAVIAKPDDTTSTDGRLARGERTRRNVAEALISLIEEGDPQPTAKVIAARAGVSLRLVFHHFADMEALYRAVMALQVTRHWETLRKVPSDLPLAQRIDRTVRQRGRLFDAISPVRRAATPQAYHSASVTTRLSESSVLLRRHLVVTFEPELEAASDKGLLEAIDATTSWETWERLRRTQGLTSPAARRIVARMLTSLLDPVHPATQPAGATRSAVRSGARKTAQAPAHKAAKARSTTASTSRARRP